MKYISIFLFLLSPLVYGDTYKLALYQWAPFTDAERDDGGISTEIIRQALRTQGHSVEIVKMPWARSLAMLEKHAVDILPAVWFTEERKKTMHYSEAYTFNRLVFIKPKASDYEYSGMESLHGKVLGVIRGYAYDGKITDEKKITFSVVDSLESNIRKVINGRIDLTLDDEVAIKATVSPELLSQVSLTQNALSEVPLYLTCQKSNVKCNEIIRAFNEGLVEIKNSGVLNTLLSGSNS